MWRIMPIISFRKQPRLSWHGSLRVRKKWSAGTSTSPALPVWRMPSDHTVRTMTGLGISWVSAARWRRIIRKSLGNCTVHTAATVRRRENMREALRIFTMHWKWRAFPAGGRRWESLYMVCVFRMRKWAVKNTHFSVRV